MARRLFSDYGTCGLCGNDIARTGTRSKWIHLSEPPGWPHAFYDHLPEPKEAPGG